MTNHTATVEALTADVRVLMVGSRQVTMSMYEQLDRIDFTEIQPFGRVCPRNNDQYRIYIVGTDLAGVLSRSWIPSALAWHKDEDKFRLTGESSWYWWTPENTDWYGNWAGRAAELKATAAVWAALPLIVLAGLR